MSNNVRDPVNEQCPEFWRALRDALCELGPAHEWKARAAIVVDSLATLNKG